MRYFLKFYLIFSLFTLLSAAQQKDPYTILEEVKTRFNLIKDYSVDAVIKVDINFLRVPETKATIYFKQPDKVRLMSEGFALLPKEGLNFSPLRLLNFDFSAIYVRTDTIDTHPVDVIKVIPNNEDTEVILSSMWIDAVEHTLIKIETTTKKSGTFQVELNYDTDEKWGLPSTVKFSFNVADLQIPASLSGEFNNQETMPEKDKKSGRGDPIKGTVIVDYNNYRVNEGIDDSIFEEEKKSD